MNFCANYVLLQLVLEADEGVQELHIVANHARARVVVIAPSLVRCSRRYDFDPILSVCQAWRAELRYVLELFIKLLEHLQVLVGAFLGSGAVLGKLRSIQLHLARKQRVLFEL